MGSFIDIIYFILAIAALAVFIYVMVNGYFRWSRNSRSPVVTVKAEVSAKRSCGSSDNLKKRKAAGEYYVTFLNTEGAEKELRVTGSEFSAIEAGQSGTLIYRDGVMLSFEARSDSSDENEVSANEE